MNIKAAHDDEAERNLIGCLVLGGDRVAQVVHIGAAQFFIPAHRILWATAMDILKKSPEMNRDRVDFVALKNRLKKDKMLEECGGDIYVGDIYHSVPNWIHFLGYEAAVRDTWKIRQSVEVCASLLEYAPDAENWDDMRDQIELKLVPLLAAYGQAERAFKEITFDWHDELSGRKERLEAYGISFGLKKLDAILGQQQPGELVIIGAGTSVGKSLLAAQGAIFNCLTERKPVGWVSLEMTETQYLDRMVSHVAKVPMNRFRAVNFEQGHIDKINSAVMQLAQMPFHFTRARIDLETIKTAARIWAARDGIRLLVIDYLQRVRSRRKFGSRQEEVAYISSELKELALDLGIVVWCPVQLNKEFEVRESAAIGFDADIMIRILLNVNSSVNGVITFDKYRMGQKKEPMKIAIEGWFMTVLERDWEDDRPEEKEKK